ncbi:MAG: BREX-2 system adenine-specific DNA-methyltransferase PglX [Sandaracinaceae bacterium]|nr:BREX-2 system adenine-specific DNA-methyltransferase PglX [Sandaracinaceae bacterium]
MVPFGSPPSPRQNLEPAGCLAPRKARPPRRSAERARRSALSSRTCRRSRIRARRSTARSSSPRSSPCARRWRRTSSRGPRRAPRSGAALTARHAEEKKNDRTADAYAVWLRRFVEQVAAAWILSCVFVRTLEDRGLLEHARIAGPGAMDSQRTFLQLAPSLSEREYLWTVFREMTRLPAASELFDAHDPVWMLAPSAEAAKTLLQLFRAGSDEAPSLRFGQADTRFLGDLYQDLNESVRERYALLQTPDFVERFILDRTLEPAIEKFGLSDTDLIDPTCGSGHFLLGAFDRLFEHHRRAEPGLPAREAARRALDKIYGADINPYAVAIAKFRLTLSYLEKAGHAKLSEAPRLPLHLAVADSLLYNPQHAQGELFHQEGAEAAKWEKRAFDFEHEREARDVLHRQYAAVVGNPPYITVKDKALRERYRALYASASGKYSLSVPFAERFFQLARPGGRVGQITANSFMEARVRQEAHRGVLRDRRPRPHRQHQRRVHPRPRHPDGAPLPDRTTPHVGRPCSPCSPSAASPRPPRTPRRARCGARSSSTSPTSASRTTTSRSRASSARASRRTRGAWLEAARAS